MELQVKQPEMLDIAPKEVPIQTTSTLPETLASLPYPVFQGQCVIYNSEILICGGFEERNCYSYDTIKDEYKVINYYPINVGLQGHCVLEWRKKKNGIKLLSFGGHEKHTLFMDYVSVWDEDKNKSAIKTKKTKLTNRWLQLVDHNNNKVFIGRKKDNYDGMRAIIGGKKNNLLFITYYPNNIDVFNLNTHRYINHSNLPAGNDIHHHCFIKRKNNNRMLLFCYETILSILYNENDNKFEFHKIRILSNITSISYYAYVHIDDFVLFFGGWNGILDNFGPDHDLIPNENISNKIYKYTISEERCVTLDQALPIPLSCCVATLNEDNQFVHVLGGYYDYALVSAHIKMKIKEMIKTDKEKEIQKIAKEQEKIIIEQMKKLDSSTLIKALNRVFILFLFLLCYL
ncbi:hypothetical protein RFI_31882 [Reticulomyxa filosa]|uniref:Kelch motif family protein n=1 Tax=Reticulomyxa filosa TaxID=46433 RepID=X6LUB8_RETFI|nr:hypothetical protein RFI_31882 [Reticulomyxa filosa]|eukprot:ETO05513.1 hypothetical protein RFI_31882 [Reticulomyxa filosa]